MVAPNFAITGRKLVLVALPFFPTRNCGTLDTQFAVVILVYPFSVLSRKNFTECPLWLNLVFEIRCKVFYDFTQLFSHSYHLRFKKNETNLSAFDCGLEPYACLQKVELSTIFV